MKTRAKGLGWLRLAVLFLAVPGLAQAGARPYDLVLANGRVI